MSYLLLAPQGVSGGSACPLLVQPAHSLQNEGVVSQAHPASPHPNFFSRWVDEGRFLIQSAEQVLLPHLNPVFQSAHHFVDYSIHNQTDSVRVESRCSG